MSGFLRQMLLFLSGGEGGDPGGHVRPQAWPGSVSPVPAPSSRNKSIARKSRDPELEALASTLLAPLAPELAARVTVGWNPCMRTTAGVALVTRGEVWLNPALREISPEETGQTLRHELAHLLAQHRAGRRRIAPHGSEWRKACADLGIAGEERTHRLPFEARRLSRRWLLRCPSCGDSHARVRPPRRRVACLACCRLHSGGDYDERYRFLIERNGD